MVKRKAVYCHQCSITLAYSESLVATKMRPIYVFIKGKREHIGYVCPACGYTYLTKKIPFSHPRILKSNEVNIDEQHKIVTLIESEEGEIKK